MRRFKTVTAAVVLALGVIAAAAPVASATTCEAILGEEACAQLNDTTGFVKETANSVGPIVDEQRDRVATLGGFAYETAKGAADTVVATVLCIVGGGCI